MNKNETRPPRSDSLMRRLKDHPLIAVVVVASAIVVAAANFGRAVETVAGWLPRRSRPQLIMEVRLPRLTVDSVFLPVYVFNASSDTWRITGATIDEIAPDFEHADVLGYDNLDTHLDTVVIQPNQTVSFVVRAFGRLLYWKGACGKNPRLAVEFELLGSKLRGLHTDPLVFSRVEPSRLHEMVVYHRSESRIELPSGKMTDSADNRVWPFALDKTASQIKALAEAAYKRARPRIGQSEIQLVDSCAVAIKNGIVHVDSTRAATRPLPYYLFHPYPKWNESNHQ